MSIVKALTATQIEKEIVRGINGEEVPDNISKIIGYLHSVGVDGPARHIGSKKYSVTPEWAVYSNKKSAPKTDIIIGDKKISVKSKNNFQIMDANKNELLALFYCSANNTDILKSRLSKIIIDSIEKLTYNQISNSTVGKSRKENPIIREADIIHKELRENIEHAFAINLMFKKNFIQEVLCGRYKFGSDSEASATHILLLSDDDIIFSHINNRIINMFMNKIDVDVSFSSRPVKGIGSAGKYTYWSVVRMIVNDLSEKLLFEPKRIKNIINHILSLFVSIKHILYFIGLEPEISVTVKHSS